MKTPRFTYPYPRPALTVDLVVLTREASPRILLIQRAKEPFADAWALPGGFVDEGETLEAAARRELLEETGLEVKKLKQLITMGNPGRDPRGWTVSVVFVASVSKKQAQEGWCQAGDDAKNLAWYDIKRLPKCAFDHRDIIKIATRAAKN